MALKQAALWFTFNGLNGIESRKAEFFMTTAVRTPNATSCVTFDAVYLEALTASLNNS
jgi:hypothetical protein